MTQPLPDLSNYDIDTLKSLYAAIEELLKHKQESGRDELLHRLEQEATRLGFDDIQSLIDGKTKRPKKYKTKANGVRRAKAATLAEAAADTAMREEKEYVARTQGSNPAPTSSARADKAEN